MLISLVGLYSDMGNNVTRALTIERLWYMLQDGPMTSEIMYQEYINKYGIGIRAGLPTPNSFGQILLRSGMMRKVVGKEGRDRHGRRVAYWEARTVDEIVEPYLTKTHTLRKLSRMPKFIRDIVAEKRGEQNVA